MIVHSRIETAEQFEAFAEDCVSSIYLVQRDGESSVALIWPDEEGEWGGARPVAEEDIEAGLPQEEWATGMVRIYDVEPWTLCGGVSFTPFVVLWHEAMGPAQVEPYRSGSLCGVPDVFGALPLAVEGDMTEHVCCPLYEPEIEEST